MKTRTYTTIVLDSSTHIYSNRYQAEPFASLVLSSTTETISIQFSPQHVNVLEELIAELKAIESQQQADRLALLNRELNDLQQGSQNVTTINGNGKSPVDCTEF